ncbi:MAG: sigma-70 family RNA polymerase sigma factor, partial [Verrucomicrobiaceae bacterium]
MDSDTELLHRFATTGDEAAFSLLVERHAPMIQGVALRGTGDQTLAEEVTQTVFAILVRKARALRNECPAAWLHRTAFFEARNARRKASRYQHTLFRFRHLLMTPPDSGSDSATSEEITPHLDEALTRLPAKNRQLVVLRFYESKSVSEIAAATGTNEEACKKQIQRSLHRLGDLLRRRGIRTTSTGLAAFLSAQTFCAVSAPAAVIAAAALRAAPTVSFLTLHLMSTTTILKTSAVMLVLAAIPVTVLWQRNHDLTAQLDRMRMGGSGT